MYINQYMHYHKNIHLISATGASFCTTKTSLYTLMLWFKLYILKSYHNKDWKINIEKEITSFTTLIIMHEMFSNRISYLSCTSDEAYFQYKPNSVEMNSMPWTTLSSSMSHCIRLSTNTLPSAVTCISSTLGFLFSSVSHLPVYTTITNPPARHEATRAYAQARRNCLGIKSMQGLYKC